METQSGTAKSPERESPRDVIGDEVAKLLPGMTAAAHAIGIQAMKGVFDDARKRTLDSHRAMARAAGMEDVIDKAEGDAMGGDININCPKTIHYPTPETAAITPPKKGIGTVGKVLTGAAILASGGGLGYLAHYMLTPKPAVPTSTSTSTTEGFLIDLVPGEQPKPQEQPP